MPVALLLHLFSIPAMAMYLLFAVPAEGWQHLWKRLPLFLLLWIAFTTMTVLHICGHLLDEILFYRYRKTRVYKPVFILGIPRSGTTYLQRLLANDERFTTLTTWEAVLAPSITQRYLFQALGWILKPLERAVVALRRRLFRQMDTIHQIRLQEPEEDFLLFLPVMACLLLAFVCPRSSYFWRLGNFDKRLPAWYRKSVMNFYYRCLQKHLYFHKKGAVGELCLLSKNPSFTAMANSLLLTFPDAKIIACTRAPTEVIPSQLSSLRPAMSVLGSGKLSAQTQQKMIGLLYHYYAQLVTLQNNPRLHLLPMSALQSDLEAAINTLFSFLGLKLSPALVDVAQRHARSSKYDSNHHYSLAEFSLSESEIVTRFKDVWPIPAPDTKPDSWPT